MKNIARYNSSYPLDYYKIGTVYAFYARAGISGDVASDKYVDAYAKYLADLPEVENTANLSNAAGNVLKPVIRHREAMTIGVDGLVRFYAVVVDKIHGAHGNNIVVMFCNHDGGNNAYYTKQYVVSSSCETDGKELMPVKKSLNFNVSPKPKSKVGGITKKENSQKVGTVTLANVQNTDSSSVGKVTLAKQDQDKPQKKVGGITLAKKVGGITLVRR